MKRVEGFLVGGKTCLETYLCGGPPGSGGNLAIWVLFVLLGGLVGGFWLLSDTKCW